MSPILIRPVREQLEHDRLIRHLATKYKKYEVSVNVGDEQVAPVRIGPLTLYPDVVWTDGKRLAGVAEVETSESVNNLEAMGRPVRVSASEGGNAGQAIVVPPIKVRDFHFTSLSDAV